MDDKKQPTQPEGTNQNQKTSSQNRNGANQISAGGTRRVLAKRWMYPAIYLGAAALIIGLMYAKSQMASHPASVTVTNPEPTATTGKGQQPTTTSTEGNYQWPVASSVSPAVSKGFFSATDSPKQQAADLVSFNGGYAPHLGYDIKAKDGHAFTVTAAIGGQVTNVGKSDLNGSVVEILSNDGNLEKYSSLSRIDVKQGDMVQQGQAIGTAGTSMYEQSQGNHVYFEIDNANSPVDPATVLPKLQK